MKLMRKCECGRYTLKEKCPICGSPTSIPAPPPYKVPDRYAEYRRRAKLKWLKEKGWM